MVERDITIKNETGIHARPASLLVREAMKHSCSVQIIKDGTEANLKSIMSLLSLAVVSGTTVTIKADGEGEEAALEALVTLIENEISQE